jgi:hypothetical protein
MGKKTTLRPRVIRITLSQEDSLTRAERQPSHTISAHFDTDTYRAFKTLGAVQCKTTNGMLNEALALLFQKHRCDVPTSVSRKLRVLGIK